MKHFKTETFFPILSKFKNLGVFYFFIIFVFLFAQKMVCLVFRRPSLLYDGAGGVVG